MTGAAAMRAGSPGLGWLALALALTPAAAPALSTAVPGPAEEALRAAAAEARAAGQDVFPLRFDSPELAQNVQGNPGQGSAVVRLPRDAGRCRDRAACWLVLYLPGFDADPEQAVRMLGTRLDALERDGAAPPVVLVAVDGRTRLGGGFYVDSPASGRFQSMILEQLLPAVRRGLELPLPASRTLVAGHSMGGFGALWLALSRPGEFAGAAAFNPAARALPMAERMLRAVERVRDGGPVDPAGMVEHPDPARFQERLLWAMCAAFLPAASRPGGVALPFDPGRRPWRLSRAAAGGLARHDLGRPLSGALARGARAVPRIVVTGGGRDRLIPPEDVESLAAALSAARGPGRAVKLVMRPDGDHGSSLAADFADAVVELTRER